MDRIEAEKSDTRGTLIETGLRLFGRDGFEATSTRAIAGEANTNIASIAYHFGGKDGLRRACAEAIIARVRKMIEPVIGNDDEPVPDADMAAAKLEGMSRTMVQFLLTNPAAAHIAPFILREMGRPGPAIDIIYGGAIGPIHRHICRLWEAATGCDAESEATRLRVFSLLGQLVYFRIGQPVVKRRMEWETIGAAQADAVANMLAGNVRAMIAAARAETEARR